MDILAKRLLGVMQRGFRLEAENGHIYIIADAEADYIPQELRYFCKKTYGNIEDALDLIEERLKFFGYISSLEDTANNTLLKIC